MPLRRHAVVLGAAALYTTTGASHLERPDACPGDFQVGGHGSASLVRSSSREAGGRNSSVSVEDGQTIVAGLGSRTYFASSCAAGTYDPQLYTRSNPLGKTLRFTVDLRGAGCGCDAMVYLTAMGRSEGTSSCPDRYCDAGGSCGEACAEVDVMEANQHAWHSTLHSSRDTSGAAAGFGGGGAGWSGPRDWTAEQYGPGGKCIDTTRPFQVAASFPVGDGGLLAEMRVALSQDGQSCPLSISIAGYEDARELTEALSAGMTPVVSYWSGRKMGWMDGAGPDGKGPCGERDRRKEECADSVRISNFSLAEIDNSTGAEPDASERPPTFTSFAGDGPSPTPANDAWLMDSPGLGGNGGWMTSPYSRAEGSQIWVDDLGNFTDEPEEAAGLKAGDEGWLKAGFLLQDGGAVSDDVGAPPPIARHFEALGGALGEATGVGSSWLASALAACLVGGAACAAAAGIGLGRALRRSGGAAAVAAASPAQRLVPSGAREAPGAAALRSVASSQMLLATSELELP